MTMTTSPHLLARLRVRGSPGRGSRAFALASMMALLGSSFAPAAACAQQDPQSRAARERPQERRPDVHFVPTPMGVVDQMLAVAKVGPDDVLYDLGSGDGRIVITAAKRHGARAIGIDIDPERIRESRHNADTAGVGNRVEFRQADLFETDLRKASVVTLYLLRELNIRLRPKLLEELRPGTRIVSHAFDMGEWLPDSSLRANGNSVFYWEIPADARGTWALTTSAGPTVRRYEVRLEQEYQQLSGTATVGGQTMPLADAKLMGERIVFNLPDGAGGNRRWLRFEGRVEGNAMSGSFSRVDGPRLGTWRATRGDGRQ